MREFHINRRTNGITSKRWPRPLSDDAPPNDPTFGQAQVLVTSAVAGPQTTLTSQGRAGDARRNVEAVVE